MTELSAFVARINPAAEPVFLHLAPNGGLDWVDDPRVATPFESFREANRRAARLPSGLRAFGLLRGCERQAAA